MNQLLGPGVVLTEVLCASYVLLYINPKSLFSSALSMFNRSLLPLTHFMADSGQ